jgi:transcriptional regulator with XRE-family HTH domain
MGRASRPRPRYLGKKLLTIRRRFGISQAAMCTRLGFRQIHPAHISAYERGLREPPLPVVLKYAKLAGFSTDYLIDDHLTLPRKWM